jgi:hypothetical protein
MASCSKNGKNCKIVYRYRDTCAALAVAGAGSGSVSTLRPAKRRFWHTCGPPQAQASL